MPSPVAKAPHPVDALATEVAGEQRAEPVPSQPSRFVADINPALKQRIFQVSQRQREAHRPQHSQPDQGDADLRGRGMPLPYSTITQLAVGVSGLKEPPHSMRVKPS
jgi:hypothetical protein